MISTPLRAPYSVSHAMFLLLTGALNASQEAHRFVLSTREHPSTLLWLRYQLLILLPSGLLHFYFLHVPKAQLSIFYLLSFSPPGTRQPFELEIPYQLHNTCPSSTHFFNFLYVSQAHLSIFVSSRHITTPPSFDIISSVELLLFFSFPHVLCFLSGMTTVHFSMLITTH